MNNRWSIPADYYIRVFDEVIDKKILDSVNKELMSLDTIKEIDDPYSIPAVSETHWEPHRWYHPKTGEFNIREKELESRMKLIIDEYSPILEGVDEKELKAQVLSKPKSQKDSL